MLIRLDERTSVERYQAQANILDHWCAYKSAFQMMSYRTSKKGLVDVAERSRSSRRVGEQFCKQTRTPKNESSPPRGMTSSKTQILELQPIEPVKRGQSTALTISTVQRGRQRRSELHLRAEEIHSGAHHSLGPVTCMNLSHYTADMNLYGAFGYSKCARYELVGVPEPVVCLVGGKSVGQEEMSGPARKLLASFSVTFRHGP